MHACQARYDLLDRQWYGTVHYLACIGSFRFFEGGILVSTIHGSTERSIVEVRPSLFSILARIERQEEGQQMIGLIISTLVDNDKRSLYYYFCNT